MSSHQDLLAQLDSYVPETSEQLQIRDRVSTFVHEYPNCLERNNFHGHITASAWVIDPTGEKALLTLHRKIGLWLQLGGHAEGDTDLLSVALREVNEESGLTHLKPVVSGIFDLDIHRIPAVGHEPSHYHFDVRFLFQLQKPQALIMSDESIDLAWYTADEIHALKTDTSVRRLCQKWLCQ